MIVQRQNPTMTMFPLMAYLYAFESSLRTSVMCCILLTVCTACAKNAADMPMDTATSPPKAVRILLAGSLAGISASAPSRAPASACAIAAAPASGVAVRSLEDTALRRTRTPSP